VVRADLRTLQREEREFEAKLAALRAAMSLLGRGSLLSFPCLANRGRIHFSRLAESDLLKIAAFSLQTWGKAQTARYLAELETCWQTSAEQPALGRKSDYVRSGLRRMERGCHVVFYRQQQDGILISRILHRRMLSKKHSIDDRDDRQ